MPSICSHYLKYVDQTLVLKSGKGSIERIDNNKNMMKIIADSVGLCLFIRNGNERHTISHGDNNSSDNSNLPLIISC
jgi:hypothetical protein